MGKKEEEEKMGKGMVPRGRKSAEWFDRSRLGEPR
jgi:hypothetical protein